jgi:hypothetical protein
MAQSKLTTIAAELNSRNSTMLSRGSVSWLRQKISMLTSTSSIASGIARERDRTKGRVITGGLYFFYYDPKNANKLPYYDTFPLVLILEKYQDGFLGLNFHYLPVMLRAAFLDKLMNYATGDEQDDATRIRITYDILRATKSMKAFQPCIKKYLITQMGGRPLRVSANEWETAMFLPVEQFHKKKKDDVYRESIEKINTEYLDQFKKKEE